MCTVHAPIYIAIPHTKFKDALWFDQKLRKVCLHLWPPNDNKLLEMFCPIKIQVKGIETKVLVQCTLTLYRDVRGGKGLGGAPAPPPPPPPIADCAHHITINPPRILDGYIEKTY